MALSHAGSVPTTIDWELCAKVGEVGYQPDEDGRRDGRVLRATDARHAQAVRVDEPTFEALFNADIAKSVLEHFWANVRPRLPLTSKSDRLRPEDLLAALAYSGKETIRSVSYCSSSVCGSRRLGRYPRCQRRLKSPLQPALRAVV